MSENIKIVAKSEAFDAAIAEFFQLLSSEFECKGSGKIRQLIGQLFVYQVLDFSKLVCIQTDFAASVAGNVFLSFHPSDIFLQLLAAMRAGDGCDD